MPQSKKQSDDRPQEDGPFSLPDLDESTSEQEDTSTGGEEDNSSSPNGDTSTSEQEDMSTTRQSKLKQHLDLVVEHAPGPSSEKPGLSTKPNAYISDEVESTLRQVVNVLETRYGTGFSKSLFVDYALRMVLMDVFHNAEESEIVAWLDEILKG